MSGSMLHSITFKRDHYCFAAGHQIDFREPVTLLVGDQGTGKSTIMELLSGKAMNRDNTVAIHSDPVQTLFIDMERNNPRTKRYLDDASVFSDIASRFRSHGESNLSILRSLKKAEGGPFVILIDEPDSALSVRSCHEIARMFINLSKKGHQIIAVVHSPIIMGYMSSVYSVEHGKWMQPNDFLDTQNPGNSANTQLSPQGGTDDPEPI